MEEIGNLTAGMLLSKSVFPTKTAGSLEGNKGVLC